MSNIQLSVNSLLTTGAALKTLNQDEEIRKAKAEKLDLEKQLLQEQIKNAKNAKISEAYTGVLKNPMKELESIGSKTLRTTKDLCTNPNSKSLRTAKDSYANPNSKSDETLRTAKYLYASSYNFNPEFAKSMKSANDLYNNSYNSLNSFIEEYNNRKSDGGNKQW